MLGGWYPTASLQECEKMQCDWCREKSGIAEQGRTNKDGATKYYINWWPTWRDRLFSREKGEGNKQQHLSRILLSFFLSFFGCPVLLTLGTFGRAGTDKWWSAGRACHMSRNRGRNLWQCEIYSECMKFVLFRKTGSCDECTVLRLSIQQTQWAFYVTSPTDRHPPRRWFIGE